MPRVRHIAVILLVWTTMLVASIASAHSGIGTKTRVWGFDLVAPPLVGLSALVSAEHHPEKPPAYDARALGNPLAAEGVGVAEATVAREVTFIGQESGPSIAVPRGATGPTPAWNGAGVQYTGGTGGSGLSPKVSGLRIMEPTLPKGPSPGYPSGYGSYFNATGQTVNPLTGRTIAPWDPWWHIPLQ